jgi:hypothetical protein
MMQGLTALHLAAKKGFTKKMCVLIEAGASVGAVDQVSQEMEAWRSAQWLALDRAQ